jgi:putative transposase
MTQRFYRGFPKKLHHEVPAWAEEGSLFHIRTRVDRHQTQAPLTDPALAAALLDSARFHQSKRNWHVTLFLVMPDHIHGLMSFPREKVMSDVVGDWKQFHSRTHHLCWQDGYFDHRLRDDEHGDQLAAKMNYIRQNPVAAGLCARAEDWPWIIDPFR